MVELPDHNIKAIFFDLDGVLVDAADWHREAFNQTLESFGWPQLEMDDHLKNFNGLSTYKKLDILRTRGFLKGDTGGVTGPPGWHRKLFYEEKQNRTENIIQERCRPSARIIDVVNYVNCWGRTAVVTNCSRATCELMLKLSNLEGRFEFIITNEDVEGLIKPNPRPYLMARYRMGLQRKEALAIEDTDKGISSAINAQLRTWRLKDFKQLSVRNLMKALEKFRTTI